MLRGRRALDREREQRAQRRAAQHERQRATGYAGGDAELGHVVAYELRQRGYTPGCIAYGGHLVSVGGRWNFQGNVRLAQLMNMSLRSAQRYRARLEADGLLRSYLLEPGDMVEGQRSPVRRPHVVRDLSALRQLGLARMPARQRTPRRDPRSGTGRDRAGRRPAVLPPLPVPMSADQLPEVAAGAEEWLRVAILGGSKPSPAKPAAPLSDQQLDDLDAELRELSERQSAARQRLEERERARQRPPDTPQRE